MHARARLLASSSTLARSSASRRSFSSASAAAAPTASSSSGSLARAPGRARCAATRLPSRSTVVNARPEPGSGSSTGRPSRVDEALALGQPVERRRGSGRRSASAQRVPQARRAAESRSRRATSSLTAPLVRACARGSARRGTRRARAHEATIGQRSVGRSSTTVRQRRGPGRPVSTSEEHEHRRSAA